MWPGCPPDSIHQEFARQGGSHSRQFCCDKRPLARRVRGAAGLHVGSARCGGCLRLFGLVGRKCRSAHAQPRPQPRPVCFARSNAHLIGERRDRVTGVDVFAPGTNHDGVDIGAAGNEGRHLAGERGVTKQHDALNGVGEFGIGERRAIVRDQVATKSRTRRHLGHQRPTALVSHLLGHRAGVGSRNHERAGSAL